jgi:hypothetical protein
LAVLELADGYLLVGVPGSKGGGDEAEGEVNRELRGGRQVRGDLVGSSDRVGREVVQGLFA